MKRSNHRTAFVLLAITLFALAALTACGGGGGGGDGGSSPDTGTVSGKIIVDEQD